MLSFLLVAIERPELTQRTYAEVAKKYKQEVIFPDKPIWKLDEKNSSQCQLGIYDDATDYKCALSVLNFCRWLAGYTIKVKGNRDYISHQLACAVNNRENGGLNHRPAENSKCYSSEAYSGCRNSNIAWSSYPSNSASDVLMYMDDSGVPSVGHRSWCLYQGLSEVSFGRITNYGAMRVMGFSYEDIESPSFFSWPPPGPVPKNFFGRRAEFMWSFHLRKFESKNPTVEVYEGKTRLQLDTSVPSAIETDYFRYHLIRFRPKGEIKVNTVYNIVVKDGKNQYKYSVKPFDVDKIPVDPETPTESKPVITTTESKPIITTTESKPVITTTESKPVITTTESKPVITTTESKPINPTESLPINPSDSNNDSQSGDNNGTKSNSGKTVAIIVVCVIVVAAVIICLALYISRRNKANQENDDTIAQDILV